MFSLHSQYLKPIWVWQRQCSESVLRDENTEKNNNRRHWATRNRRNRINSPESNLLMLRWAIEEHMDCNWFSSLCSNFLIQELDVMGVRACLVVRMASLLDIWLAFRCAVKFFSSSDVCWSLTQYFQKEYVHKDALCTRNYLYATNTANANKVLQ